MNSTLWDCSTSMHSAWILILHAIGIGFHVRLSGGENPAVAGLQATSHVTCIFNDCLHKGDNVACRSNAGHAYRVVPL